MAGTNVNPSQPALTIVRKGPYRFTRNPMYLALCLLQVALGFFLNDWISLLFVIPLALVLHYGVILREERYLEAKFGSSLSCLKAGGAALDLAEGGRHEEKINTRGDASWVSGVGAG